MRAALNAGRTAPTSGMTGTGPASRLVRAYAGRLAPAFVLHVLRVERRAHPTWADDLVEEAVRRRLDGWLARGRYPLPQGDEEVPTPTASGTGSSARHTGQRARRGLLS